MRRHLLIMILLVLVPSRAFPLISDLGLDPLDQTGSARAYGMGGAFAAYGGYIDSLFYNPAGLAGAKGIIISGRDMNNFSAGLAYDLGAGSVGFGIVYKNEGKFNNFGFDSSYSNSMGLVGYGTEYGQFALGVTVKALLSQTLARKGLNDASSSGGIEGDAGLLWRPYNWTSVGIMMRNFSAGNFTMAGSDETFPQSSRGGLRISVLGKESLIPNDIFGVEFAGDLENKDASGTILQNSYLGIELSYGGWFFLRGGSSDLYGIGSEEGNTVTSPSWGIGFKFGDAEIDAAGFKDAVTGAQVGTVAVSFSPPQFSIKKAPKAAVEETPLLTLGAPDNDLVTYDETVTVAGEVRHGAEVNINGVRAYVDDSNKFNAIQSLNPGKNLIEIEANIGGERKLMNRRVLRKAKVVISEEMDLNKKIESEITLKSKEIADKEQKLEQQKAKGVDVSAQEKMLALEKEQLAVKKTLLNAEKKKLDERKDKVENLVTLGVIEVSPKKNFQIEAPIKRGEMIMWLAKSTGLSGTMPSVTPFSDVPEKSEYAPYIRTAFDRGLISASPDNKFRPNDPVTEDEARAFFRAFGVIK